MLGQQQLISRISTGLGDRLTTLLHHWRLCQRFGLTLNVQWHRTNHCQVPVIGILDGTWHPLRTPLPEGSMRDMQSRVLTEDAVDGKTHLRCSGPQTCLTRAGEDINSETVIREIKDLARKLPWNPYVLSEAGRYDVADCVGVHIRRGDLSLFASMSPAQVQEKSFHVHPQLGLPVAQYYYARVVPLGVYTQRMDQYPPDQRFYITTDEPRLLQVLSRRYGPARIVAYPCRSTTRGAVAVQDAAICVLLLSRCCDILGGYSRFGRLAGYLHKTITTQTWLTRPIDYDDAGEFRRL